MNQGRLGLLLLAIAISLAVALLARFRGGQSAIDFQLAGQNVGVVTNAAAICGDYVSAASFLGVAASVYASGLDGTWTAVGFAAGFVPVALFIAAPLRRFGERSLSDFLGRRFRSEPVRLLAVLTVELVILMYLIPQAVAGGLAWDLLVESELPGLDGYETGIVVSTLVIGVLVTVGGMRGTTWNQALQFTLLLCIMVWVSVMLVGDGFSYGDAIQDASAEPLRAPVEDPATGVTSLRTVESQLNSGQPAMFDRPGAQFSGIGHLSLMVTLVLGTAGLPHVMNRFFTSPSGRAARMTTVWVLAFIGLFYSLAVMAGTASRSIIAREASKLDWLGELTIDGVLIVPEYALLVLGRLYGDTVGLSLMATGALIAVMSTVGGLLLAGSTSWGHDIYERHINKRASRRQALRAGQGAVLFLAAVAATSAALLRPDRLSGSVPSVIAGLVTAAFALAASTLTPALVLSIWWKRISAAGVISGLIVGGIAAISCAVYGLVDPNAPALLSSPALITTPLATLVMISVSFVSRPVADLDSIWVRMHGAAQDRRAERLASLVIEGQP